MLEMARSSWAYSEALLEVIRIHTELNDKIKHHARGEKESKTHPDSETASPLETLERCEEFDRSFFEEIFEIVCSLETIAATAFIGKAQSAMILGYGEVWSSRLIHIIAEDLFSRQRINDTRPLNQTYQAGAFGRTQAQSNQVHVKCLCLDARLVLTLNETDCTSNVRTQLPKAETHPAWLSKSHLLKPAWVPASILLSVHGVFVSLLVCQWDWAHFGMQQRAC